VQPCPPARDEAWGFTWNGVVVELDEVENAHGGVELARLAA